MPQDRSSSGPCKHSEVLQNRWKMSAWEGVLLQGSHLGLPLSGSSETLLLSLAPEHLINSDSE